MSINYIKSDAKDIRTEACTWMAQLESGDMKPADIDAFREWMKRSPRHASEMRRLATLSSSLNVLTDMAGPLQVAAFEQKQAVSSAKKRYTRKSGFMATATVFATLVIIFSVLHLTGKPQVNELWQLQLSTQIGDYREEFLPDGSIVELNTDSQISIVYTNSGRDVRLTKGEVLFTVSPDTSRPFTVRAGNKSVVAVGTAFVIRRESDNFAVTVTEGKVRLQADKLSAKVDSANQGNNLSIKSVPAMNQNQGPSINDLNNSIVLQKGQRVALNDDANFDVTPPVLESVSETEIRRELAWQDGLLEFTDTELGQVIQEVSRHTTLKIEIPDPDLRALRFGGLFRTGDTQPLFEALEAAYNIRAVYLQDDTVVLTRTGS